jgi:hypothetical protein
VPVSVPVSDQSNTPVSNQGISLYFCSNTSIASIYKELFLTLFLLPLSPSSSTANLGSRPATVGRKNGAALGAFGGSLGLFLCF